MSKIIIVKLEMKIARNEYILHSKSKPPCDFVLTDVRYNLWCISVNKDK